MPPQSESGGTSTETGVTISPPEPETGETGVRVDFFPIQGRVQRMSMTAAPSTPIGKLATLTLGMNLSPSSNDKAKRIDTARLPRKLSLRKKC